MTSKSDRVFLLEGNINLTKKRENSIYQDKLFIIFNYI